MLSDEHNLGIHRRETALGSFFVHFSQLGLCQGADHYRVRFTAIPDVLQILSDSFLSVFGEWHIVKYPAIVWLLRYNSNDGGSRSRNASEDAADYKSAALPIRHNPPLNNNPTTTHQTVLPSKRILVSGFFSHSVEIIQPPDFAPVPISLNSHVS